MSKYKLRAEFREFSIFEAKPNKVGNSHNATLRITGFDLVDPQGFDVALIQGTDTVYAYETYPQNQSELIAYVDMRNAPTGEHELLVKKRTTGDVAIWEETVQVINDYGPTLFADVAAPGASRSSEDFQVQVTYGNRGYSNFYDMLIFVAFFNDDTTSEGLSVRYMGSTYPGITSSNFISDSLNPAYDVFYDDPENPVVYAARVPIVHARSRETFTFTVNGEIPGTITTQASLSVLQRSPFTFTGRMEDVETSTYGAFLGAGMMAANSTMEMIGNAKNNCGEILNPDAMTERLANETYKVAEKARGASGMKEDVKKNYKTLTGHDAGIKERYDSYKELMSTKDELDLTANEDTPFYSEINDMFDCMNNEEPGQVDIEPIPDEDCKQIATWERGGKTFRVKMDMRGGIASCPPPPPAPDPTPTPTPKDKDETENENSEDPNEIVGPPGEGFNRLVSNDEEFRYTIYFENVEDAGAPAARVRIDNPLSDHLRLPSFRLVSFGFADTSFQFNNPPYLQETFDLGSEFGGQQLRVLSGTNPANQKAFFEFTTINPETQGIVTGAGDGFLFPNDSTGRGQGFVTYIIELKPDLEPGTEIENRASIIFDENEIIETNTWKNTIVGGQLSSRVLDLPLFSSPKFTLNWVNETPPFGPAVESFDIYVRDMDAQEEWSRWLGDTKSFKKMFTGTPGHTYGFISRAKSTGSYEPLSSEPNAVTTILDFQGDLSGDNPVLFPNPARDITTLAYRSPGAGANMRIRISTTQGKQLVAYAFSA
ncbi:MAG: hypothetical protein LC664_14565, partial [Flavobacteriales bacterium]|nr:hypothetical protein [Flavobacteriales bacterium]